MLWGVPPEGFIYWCTSCSGKRQSRAETSAPPTKPPNDCKSKKFVINNIYLLVIVNHCANVYLAVWKKCVHNFAKNCVIV